MAEAPGEDGPGLRIEADPVVGHGRGDRTLTDLDGDSDPTGRGVAHDVVQRLLDDAEEPRLDLRFEPGLRSAHQLDRQAVDTAEHLEQLGEGSHQALFVEGGRAQLEHQRTQLG
ncbi:MAG: hypothetical protein M3471_08330, partial [Actinomycetota bacterium]|nr:hypothetical protein [Actinomycetota bacterium]